MAALSEGSTPVPEPSSSKVPLYEASTQYRNWRFSFAGLAELRAAMNQVAVDAIRRKIEADEPGSSKDVSFLVPDEEVSLVKFYLNQVPAVCRICGFSEEVEATGVSYIKRFYLRNTVMDWHPKNVMLTSVFLATKTCNHPLAIEIYAKKIPKTSVSEVLELEFLVAQSLGFEFSVWHAHRALWGIWLDIQTLPDTKVDLPSSVFNNALIHVRASRLTDAEFVYTPSQIALAAFALVAPDIAKQWHSSKNSASHTMNWDIIEDIKSMILDAHKLSYSQDSVREIDRRLKLCKNPEKEPGSRAFLAKKAEEEKKAAERRSRKAAEAQKSMDDEGDPFASKPRNGLVDYDDDDDD